MANWNIGSVTDFIGNKVGWSNIPTSISGTTFSNMVSQSINFVKSYTSETIDETNISDKYQPAIIKLTQADLLIDIEAQQGGVDNIKLGDLSVSQSSGGGSELAKQLREEAVQRLKELQRAVRYKRVIGGY